jgi:DNA-binding NarL/FixJ family response regulator
MPTAEMPTAEVDLPVLAAAPGPPAAQSQLDALPDASIRAIVIDAHAPSRVGLAALLDEQPWIERCLLASGSEESVSLTRRHRPDVALLDISQTGPFAGAITAQIHAAHPGVQILLTSRCRTSPGAPPASLGAVGFLPAGVTGEDVVDAVRAAVLSGEPLDLPVASLAPGLDLNDREREILVLLGTGATNREIAARLHLGPDSVKKSATALYRKLGVRNRTEAAQRAATVLAA